MRALTAILILSACSHLHAHQPRGLKTFKNILDCTTTLGPLKCMSALTAWRAKRALNHPNLQLNLKDDLEQFQWIRYRNDTKDDLYSEVCDGTEQLLRKQPLSLTMIPGYRFELKSKGNGTLNVDVYKNLEAESGRSSMKKAKKAFYKILPLLVLPGLIMSAILPFILPVLKLMTLGAGMLNNMALSGAVFTLLRNNAFNDKYEHKVIYVNEGYKNEKHAHLDEHHELASNDNIDYQYAETKPSGFEIAEMESMEEMPLNSDWIKQYYGNGQNVQIMDNGHHYIKRDDKLKRTSKRRSRRSDMLVSRSRTKQSQDLLKLMRFW